MNKNLKKAPVQSRQKPVVKGDGKNKTVTSVTSKGGDMRAK